MASIVAHDACGRSASSRCQTNASLPDPPERELRLSRSFRHESFYPPNADGIINEADEVAGEVADKKVLDAALIAAAQAVEHYEMARYGTLIAWAKELGRDDCASVLKQNLVEESAADKKLTAIAETRVNRIAA
jgi:ferritin-like metal-binding protein YciE